MSNRRLELMKQLLSHTFRGEALCARVRGRTYLRRFGGQLPPEIDPVARATSFDLTAMLLLEYASVIIVPHAPEYLDQLRLARVPHANFEGKYAFDPVHPAVAQFIFPFQCRAIPTFEACRELVNRARARFGV